MKWQPIETAPKDGSKFVAYYPADDGEDEFCAITFWPIGLLGRYYGIMIGGVDPTHWMPLPEQNGT